MVQSRTDSACGSETSGASGAGKGCEAASVARSNSVSVATGAGAATAGVTFAEMFFGGLGGFTFTITLSGTEAERTAVAGIVPGLVAEERLSDVTPGSVVHSSTGTETARSRRACTLVSTVVVSDCFVCDTAQASSFSTSASVSSPGGLMSTGSTGLAGSENLSVESLAEVTW